MQIDDTTFADLSVFQATHGFSLFSKLDRTKTIGGRSKLLDFFNIDDMFEISITFDPMSFRDKLVLVIKNLIDLKDIENNVQLKVELQTNKFVFY